MYFQKYKRSEKPQVKFNFDILAMPEKSHTKVLPLKMYSSKKSKERVLLSYKLQVVNWDWFHLQDSGVACGLVSQLIYCEPPAAGNELFELELKTNKLLSCVLPLSTGKHGSEIRKTKYEKQHIKHKIQTPC